MAEKINIGIADDHVPFREGMIALFEKFTEIKVLFDVNNGVEVMEKLKSHTPDIILMDLDMEGMNGEEAFDLIKQKYPEINVIILTGHFNDSFVVRFIKKQAPSILSKTTPIKKIIEAIKGVHANGHFFDEAVSLIMSRAISDSAKEIETKDRPELDLNHQELQVLKFMCIGYSTKQIADKMHRSDRTIEYNRNCIWHKTDIKSKSIPELILFGLKHKILAIM